MSASPSTAVKPNPGPGPQGSSVAGDLGFRIETLALVGLLLVLLLVRVCAVNHAGPLWRDEIHSLELALDRSQPPWPESFPGLWIYSLRAWLAVCPASDFACRVFGFLCGLSVVAAGFWAARVRGYHAWATLALLCLHPIAVVYCGQFRGYAFGLTFQLLMFGTMARLVLTPATRGHWLALLVTSLLAVQASYTNCFMLLAVSAGAGVVCLMTRQWRTILGIGLNGILSAASMLPYVLYAFPEVSDTMIISREDEPLSSLLVKYQLTVATAGPLPFFLWLGLPVALIAAGAWRSARPGDIQQTASRQDYAFAITTLVIGTVAFFWYVHALRVPTQFWYYLPVMALWAFCCDLLLGVVVQGVRWARLVSALVWTAAALIAFPTAWANSAVRMTNVDVAAQTVAEYAGPRDLIVVHPWYAGITFSRYYAGETPWMTFPSVLQAGKPWTGHREFKRRMMQPHPLQADIRRMQNTLKSGGTIWLIGKFTFLGQGERPPDELPPAPHPTYGWREGVYATVWDRQAAFALQRTATRIEIMPMPIPEQVQNVELLPLIRIRGGRE